MLRKPFEICSMIIGNYEKLFTAFYKQAFYLGSNILE